MQMRLKDGSLKRLPLQNRDGFTLTEMLIVIALIALVGTFVGTQVINRFSKAKIDSTRIQIRNLGVVLDDFRRECNFYPTTDQGLEALVRKPEGGWPGGRDCKNYDPKGYVSGGKVPKDAWGNDFIYTSDNGVDYEIRSLGADSREGGEGDSADISSKEVD